MESAAYDFTKSVLIDAECMKYKSSLVVAAIISISIEIIMKLKIEERKSEKYIDPEGQKGMPILSHIE